GVLDAAVAVSDAFLNKDKTIVSIKGKDTSMIPVKEYRARADENLIPSIPMVVLINEGSASASEIVAGALQDNRRAIILGIKSFGKGSVQSVIPLNNGGGIKLTVARYYTPNNTSIQAKGIVPDIEVKSGELKELNNNKWIKSEDSLKNHLEGEKDDLVKKELEKQQLKTNNESMYNKDYQLARAIDLLLGISFYKEETK
ncbi:MAG: peptidase S41, partial [Rickettsiales bacterium]|nr:peptidase S41 [Rickettsiales bacterium]